MVARCLAFLGQALPLSVIGNFSRDALTAKAMAFSSNGTPSAPISAPPKSLSV